jgi:DNA-binding transcriptional MerR regulator
MKKLYYSISEVSKLVDEESHILRYWEKEFSELKPKKNNGGNRMYSENDLKTIISIQKLIRDEKLSLKDAKAKIKSISNADLELPFENNEVIATEPQLFPDVPKSNASPQIEKSMLKEFRELLISIKERL